MPIYKLEALRGRRPPPKQYLTLTRAFMTIRRPRYPWRRHWIIAIIETHSGRTTCYNLLIFHDNPSRTFWVILHKLILHTQKHAHTHKKINLRRWKHDVSPFGGSNRYLRTSLSFYYYLGLDLFIFYMWQLKLTRVQITRQSGVHISQNHMLI